MESTRMGELGAQRSGSAERALGILAVLRGGEGVRASALAERFGVDRRTVRRDIAKLRALGYRIDAASGPAGGYRLAGPGRLPPLLLDATQAEAVAVGLRLVASSSATGLADEARSALSVLCALLPSAAAARAERAAAAIEVVPDESTLPEGLQRQLREAIAGSVRLRFGYRDRAGRETQRCAEPYRVVRFASRWYLLAFDLDRGDWRSFRLDRISGLHRTTFTFRPRRAPDAVAYIRDAVRRGPYREFARLRLRAPIEALRYRLPPLAGELVPAGPGVCDLIVGADEAARMAPHLAALGHEILEASPPALAEALRELGGRLAAIPENPSEPPMGEGDE